MKRWIRLLAIAFVLQASGLFAQDFTGTWQGTIHTARDFREVIQISKDGNVLKATLFGIDSQAGLSFDTRPGQSFPSPPLTIQGKTVKIQFPGIGGLYQGTLSADGNSIAGGLLQNGTTLTLNLVRATAQTAWEIPNAAALEKPMAGDADPSFEVATIKLTAPGTQGSGLGPSPGGRFTAHNTTLGGLLGFAYGLNRHQIENEPAWFETDRFDLVAKTDMAGAPNMAQQRMMLQKLLADRLNLRFHREKKEGTVFALTVQNSGSRLTPNTGDPSGPSPAELTRGPGHWHLTVTNVSMEIFASGLQGIVEHPVIDRTGLSGRFDITLDWAPDDFQPQGPGVTTPPESGAAFPDLYTALRERLGLKLESTKGLVEIFVIDHVDRPSDN
ncbi:MAG TPA: TIGR03435 family protein [Bryobacteraceae bacterium]|nr:TIGR03435 family protein [Bryobacteraceae bacterium]